MTGQEKTLLQEDRGTAVKAAQTGADIYHGLVSQLGPLAASILPPLVKQSGRPPRYGIP